MQNSEFQTDDTPQVVSVTVACSSECGGRQTIPVDDWIEGAIIKCECGAPMYADCLNYKGDEEIV